MKVKIEIKNRFTGKILFEFETENNTILKTLKEAIMRDADLRGAYLSGCLFEWCLFEWCRIE
jgi:DNA-directed RNA polymerase subunit L